LHSLARSCPRSHVLLLNKCKYTWQRWWMVPHSFPGRTIDEFPAIPFGSVWLLSWIRSHVCCTAL
jgi:hypothetical protein